MASRVTFHSLEDYQTRTPAYQLLPFRFTHIPQLAGRVLITSDVGEFAFLREADFQSFVAGTLQPSSECYANLQAKHFLVEGDPATVIRLVAAKYRTKKSFLRYGPSLHIFVVSLRCDHSCSYCQVSRQSPDRLRFDMSRDTASAAINLLFASPAPQLTVEFQGGEPLLAFDRIRQITEAIIERNRTAQRAISFTITLTLHFLTEEMLTFFREYRFHLSTSLDGPAWLHNANRPTPTHDSYQRTVAAIERARHVLGHDQVAALTTLTRNSLDYPEAIIDTYVALGFPSIFLRPLSPYGFAVRAERKIGYSMERFLQFYRRALAHLLKLNREGIAMSEAYTAILLTHILTPFPTGYVDLRSPTGAGLGTFVYNYNGVVYASDESRMLAEMGDTTFQLGTVHDDYATLLQSEAMNILLATGVAEVLPGCSDCAFLPYCGADPVFSLTREGDPVGHRPTSEHCRKQTGLFRVLFEYLAEGDAETLRTFLTWVTAQSPERIPNNREAR